MDYKKRILTNRNINNNMEKENIILGEIIDKIINSDNPEYRKYNNDIHILSKVELLEKLSSVVPLSIKNEVLGIIKNIKDKYIITYKNIINDNISIDEKIDKIMLSDNPEFEKTPNNKESLLTKVQLLKILLENNISNYNESIILDIIKNIKVKYLRKKVTHNNGLFKRMTNYLNIQNIKALKSTEKNMLKLNNSIKTKNFQRIVDKKDIRLIKFNDKNNVNDLLFTFLKDRNEKLDLVITIDLSNCLYITDNGLSYLLSICPNLKNINLSNTNITIKTLFNLGKYCKKLENININRCSELSLNFTNIKNFIENCINLKNIYTLNNLREADKISLIYYLRKNEKYYLLYNMRKYDKNFNRIENYVISYYEEMESNERESNERESARERNNFRYNRDNNNNNYR